MRAEIRSFLADHAGVSKEKLADDFDLFANEVWDSLLIVRFVAFAKSEFSVDIDLTVLSEDKISTIAKAADLIAAGRSPQR